MYIYIYIIYIHKHLNIKHLMQPNDVGIVSVIPFMVPRHKCQGPDRVGGNHPQLSDSNSRPSYGGARH